MTGNDARAVSHVRRLAAAHDDDTALLHRFLSDGDADSFAELVRRHGPMVLGVCRRVLGNAADADDAFQAAFIVLAQKASSVRNGRSVASFLFGVARFTAIRARDKAARRREYEAQAVREPTAAPDADLLAAVDEELHRLPDDLRAPLIACFLRDRTQDDAARELGCSLSTLRRRLERGQAVLRQRLTGRGVAPSVALGGGSVAVSVGQVQAATAVVAAAIGGTAGSVPATELASGVIAMMGHTKLKAVAAVAAVLVLAGGVAWGLAAAQPPKPVDPKQPAPPPAKAEPKMADPTPKPAEPKKAADVIKPGDRVVIRGANLFEQAPLDPFHEVEPSGKVALGPAYGGRVKIDGLTLEEAEAAVQKHIRQYAIKAEISITRYIPPPPVTLDERVQRLEREVKELRALVEELRVKRP